MIRACLVLFALTAAALPSHRPTSPMAPQPAARASDADRTRFVDAARTAWQFAATQQNATGLITALPGYGFATIWDIASGLAMLFCARELEFIDEQQYKTRMRLALATLAKMPMFDATAFNKVYQVSTASMVDRRQRPTTTGYGWSTIDTARLLVWLRAIGNRDRDLAKDAEGVARRLDFTKMIRDGYLWGEDLGPTGERREYQEGQIGYEQYAAMGFALWGARAEHALRASQNAEPFEVLGKALMADKRKKDKLTSEPFVLMGLETGWTSEMRPLAEAVLAVQAERARRTGTLTMVSEDAIDRPPHYFYYYCIFANAKPFSVYVQEGTAAADAPRWLSTKAAFGWHALLPGEYTRKVLDAVQAARTPGGWASGIYEGTGRSTGTLNVNTEAVVMTSAVYALRGAPLVRVGGESER